MAARRGERGRGLTEVVALQSVVSAREWYSRATAVADARAQQPESSHLHPQLFGVIYCAPVTHVISCGPCSNCGVCVCVL